MKVKCIKDIGNCKAGKTYEVDYIYLADTHHPLGDAVMELMYSIIDGDWSSGYSASYFNVDDDLSKMKGLMVWSF